MKHVQRIYFNEVATRDGFQNEPRFISTDDKVALVGALGECDYTTGMAHSGAQQHY